MATLAYYWTSRREDLRDGFTIQGEALGCSCGDAIERAGALNLQLDAWRRGRALGKSLDTGTRFGTIAWLFERYRRSPAFARVSARSRPEYLRALKRIEVLPTKTVDQVGDLLTSLISARAADKIYAALQDGPRGKRVRQANLSIDDRYWEAGVETRAPGSIQMSWGLRIRLRVCAQDWR